MSKFANREPARLSGGQKQRVAIAGAVALRPRIIILDESTSMLDPEGRLDLIKTMKNIREQYGITVISITHDLDEIALSDRVLVMKEGRVESSSTPRELFARGKDLLTLGLDIPFTANLIEELRTQGIQIKDDYLPEKELEEQLRNTLQNVDYTYQEGTPFEGRALFDISLAITDGLYTVSSLVTQVLENQPSCNF